MTVLLKRFHLNGNTIGFRPQTQKFKPPFNRTDSGIERVKTIQYLKKELGAMLCNVLAFCSAS